jgi:hypothetical protein
MKRSLLLLHFCHISKKIGKMKKGSKVLDRKLPASQSTFNRVGAEAVALRVEHSIAIHVARKPRGRDNLQNEEKLKDNVETKENKQTNESQQQT